MKRLLFIVTLCIIGCGPSEELLDQTQKNEETLAILKQLASDKDRLMNYKDGEVKDAWGQSVRILWWTRNRTRVPTEDVFLEGKKHFYRFSFLGKTWDFNYEERVRVEMYRTHVYRASLISERLLPRTAEFNFGKMDVDVSFDVLAGDIIQGDEKIGYYEKLRTIERKVAMTRKTKKAKSVTVAAGDKSVTVIYPIMKHGFEVPADTSKKR